MLLENIKNKNIHIGKEQKGFAVLFAVLTSSLLVTIGVSIYGISIKELTMSTSAKDSQIAFYAADSARECAFYWDTKGAIKSNVCYKETDGTFLCKLSDEFEETIKCNGKIINYLDQEYIRQEDNNYYYSIPNFFKYSDLEDSPKADIEISKILLVNEFDMTSKTQTTIDARGRNTGIEGRRVERGIVQQSGIYDGIQ